MATPNQLVQNQQSSYQPSASVLEAKRRREELMSAYKAGNTATVNQIGAQNRAIQNSYSQPQPVKNTMGQPTYYAQSGNPTVPVRSQTLTPSQPTPTPQNPKVPVSPRGANALQQDLNAVQQTSQPNNLNVLNNIGTPNPQNRASVLQQDLNALQQTSRPNNMNLLYDIAKSTPQTTFNAQKPPQALQPSSFAQPSYPQSQGGSPYQSMGQPQGQPSMGQSQQGGSSMGFSVEDYMNMSPEQQLQAQAQAFQEQGKMQMGQLDQLFNAQSGLIDQRQQSALNDYNTQKSQLEGQDQEALNKYKQEQSFAVQQATQNIQEAGAQRQEDASLSFAFQGFGRSTKAAEIKDRIGRDTQNQIADINRQSERAVNEYQASLLERTNQRLQKYQDRIDKYGDAKAEVEFNKIKAQSDLMMDLFKQNPMNPQNMIATAEKLKAQRIEQQKLDMEERKELMKSTRENFTYMMDTFGSKYLDNLDNESLQNLAGNLGVPASALRNVGPTMKEIEKEWEKLKYASEYNLKEKQFAFDVARSDRDFSYKVQSDEDQRLFQMAMNDRNFQQDLAKIGVNFDYDAKKLYLGQQFKDAESQKKYANLGYGNFSAAAQSSAPNGSALFFDTPQKHPATGSQVVAMNPKLVNAYPAGYKKSPSSGPNGLGGQCAYEARGMCNIPPLGNSLSEKTNKLKGFIKQGKGFMKGQGQPQPGDVLISSLAKGTGHVAVVNAVTADGKIILSEFNVKPLSFTNNRTISATAPEVVGFIRGGVKPQYQVKAQDQKAKSVNDTVYNVLSENLKKMDPNSPAAKKMQAVLAKIGVARDAAGQDAVSRDQEAQGFLASQGGQLPPDIANSPEKLASFVQQNGLSNLQQYDWWNNNSNKAKAWEIMQSNNKLNSGDNGSMVSEILRRNMAGMDPNSPAYQKMKGVLDKLENPMGGQSQNFQQPQNVGNQFNQGQFQQPVENVDEYGQQLTPDRQALRSGQMPEFMAKQTYDQLNEGYNATGNPQLKAALDQFMMDYQVGQKSSAKMNPQQFQGENTLRDEFTKNTQNFVKIRDSYNTIEQAGRNPNAANDLSLIFAYMKILDPGSTVREGEFANAQNAVGVPDQIRNMFNKAQSGERLNDQQRQQFINSARAIYESQKVGYDRQVEDTKRLAQSYGFDPSRVMYNFANQNTQNFQQNNQSDPLNLGFSQMGGGSSNDPLGLGI